MTNTRKTWWYAAGQEKIGPCSGSELMDLVAQGKLFPDTLVWKEGMANWVPASRIKGLWQKLPATPPAAPHLPSSAASIGASAAMPQEQQQFGGFNPPPASQASTWPEEDDYEDELPPREEMTFKKAIQRCFKKYFDFSGRAGRAEYWYFALLTFLILFPLFLLVRSTGGDDSPYSTIFNIVNLVLTIPSLAVGARRLHDIGRSGWWQLLHLTFIGSLVLIFWWVQKGDDDANEYGYPE